MVDKLYIMLPEFKIDEYDYKRAKDDFQGEKEVVDRLASVFTGSNLMDDLSDAPIEFKEWFAENKEKYKLDTPKFRKIKYNHNKTPQENSLKARNNLLIDMMWGVLTNPDTASKILNPGGFDYQKRAARIVSILQSNREADLRRELGVPQGPVITKLLSMSVKELDEFSERTKKKLNPLSPTTQVQLHQQNMTGANMIGIYANHNANHALMQHTELGLDSENGAFTLNGKRLTSLHSIMNDDKEFISKNNAGFLAASVDNAKDPILADINQNSFTADATMLLSRLGYNPIEIGLLMAQPIVVDMTKAYFRERRSGKNKDTIIDEVLNDYKKRAALMEENSYDNYKNNKFLIEDLANYILIAKESKGLESAKQTSDYDKVEFFKKQAAVGFLFKRIMKDADSLAQVVQALRSDAPKNAAGPTIADTEIRVQKVQDLLTTIANDRKFPLVGADVISDDISVDDDIDALREKLLSSKLPYMQAFYTLGVKQSRNMLNKYFPQFTQPFIEVIDMLRGMTRMGRLDVKTMNSVYNDLLAYIMSKTNFFGAEPAWDSVDESGTPTKMLTSTEKRRDFINNFPSRFKKIVSENEDIAGLEFIKRLRVIRANAQNPVETVVFKNVGRLSPVLRERYMRDWASLLYMSNPAAQKLALDLFRYSFYRNGFAFGPNTFIHLAPVAIRNAVPEYIDTLRSLLTSEDTYLDFVDQYVYNHLDNRKLVPEVPEGSTVSFMNENKEALDEVTFVIDDNSNSVDKKVVKKRIDTPDGPMYDFYSFIAKRIRGNYVYYKLTADRAEELNVAVYQRIEPLGFKNSFLEYEYGKQADEMTSVIEKNSKDYNPSKAAEYESFAEDVSDNQEVKDDDPFFSEEYRNAFFKDALNESYERVYGTSLEGIQDSETDFASMEPNTDFRDDNGDKLCGA